MPWPRLTTHRSDGRLDAVLELVGQDRPHGFIQPAPAILGTHAVDVAYRFACT